MSSIENKKVVVGITGGIAAYISCELVRNLVKKGASVQVVMTKNSHHFVTPLTLQTLSGKKVLSDQFDLDWESEIGHIEIADSADLVVVAPATASFIGKTSSGIADSLLGTVILATKAPVIFCPSMNVNMYNNSIVQENIKKLKKHGIHIVEPEEGNLACGWEGKGRLANIESISREIEKRLSVQDLKGKKILVTAGATREYIDPVRFISNPSTGKMGYSIAKAAWTRGADVLLISAYSELEQPHGVKFIKVENAEEMFLEVNKYKDDYGIIIKAAAVSDYKPTKKGKNKIKKSEKKLSIDLERTKDILLEIGKNKNGTFLVGFAAETENTVKNAKLKRKNKNADLIIANNIKSKGSGFGTDTNEVQIVYRNGSVKKLSKMSKEKLGNVILDIIQENKTT